jgi:glycosyltransferase 2 family protein
MFGSRKYGLAPFQHSGLRILFREIFRVGVTAGLFLLLSRSIDWQELRGALVKADATELILAALALSVALLFSALRWQLCARSAGIDQPIGFYLRATYAATFMGQFLPAGVGVDAVRLAFFLHGRARLAQALQSLVLDRLLGVVAMISVMAAGLPIIWVRLPPLLRLLGCSLILGLVAGMAMVWSITKLRFIADYRGGGKRGKLIDLATAIRGSVLSRDSLKALTVSVVIYCSSIAGVYCIALSLGIALNYFELLAVVSMAMFLALLPVSLNGWGVREGAMIVGLSALSVNREPALLISLLFGFGAAVVTLPGGFFWYLKKQPVVAPRE